MKVFNRGRPKANFVLWQNGLDFYVSKRVGPCRESSMKEHFVGFFESKQIAYWEAEKRTQRLILTLEGYIKRYRKDGR